MKAGKKTGRFIVVEGADGVGKSTVLKLLLPQLMESGQYSTFRFFHWKPVKGEIHDGGIPETVPHDPRGKQPRNALLSLVYLKYHWLTFWMGYLQFVRPVLKRGGLVIADRYTYDVLLDPQRFRLKVPAWTLRLFVRTLPHPDIILALVAEPATIIARKPELSIAEIEAYQKGLQSGILPNIYIINAEPAATVVADQALVAIREVR